MDGINGEDLPRFIESNRKAICVVAGPGAGKSLGISRRLQRLVRRDGVDPKRIFVGTFTRAIAAELQKAVGAVPSGTIHGLSRRLLQQHPEALAGRSMRFLLRYEEDSMLHDIGLRTGDGLKHPQRRKLMLRTQSDWAERRDLSDARFAGAIEEWLRNHRGMLIGEVVPLTTRALESGDIAQGQFDHLVVDEY